MGARNVVVLAAGKGTRMRSRRPKVLHRIAGRSLIERVLSSSAAIEPRMTTVVLGHMAEEIKQTVGARPSLTFALQEPQLGTAHALQQTDSHFADKTGSVVVLSGDVPRLRPATLLSLVEHHEQTAAACTMLTTTLDRPYGYGRVIRSQGELVGVVEEADATAEQRKIREINGGIYVFELEPLFKALAQIPEAGPKHERYLPAIIPLYRQQGLIATTFPATDSDEIRGINSQTELAEVSGMVRRAKNEELMGSGVTIENPATTYVDDDVRVGADTVIHPGVMLEGQTTVGERCELHSGVRVVDSAIGDDVTIRNHCIVTESSLGSGTVIGPFAHLRPGSKLETNTRVGNFVELKKTTLGEGSKANHLSYLGDATVGRNVNIGAGTITCNYDGREKHETCLEDGVFIGSGSQLVAPITVGRDGYVAAGSCITEDVPADALAITRGRQTTKTGWVVGRKGDGE
jgi:bifunctional UDP-N-acetylglucosamine pyrophosphorylase/glucosamine-1-phosphate N-acetyltransferase